MTIDLELRFRQLSEEIRNYPRPIARCDEQLTALIEERANLAATLQAQHDSYATGGCTPAAIWTNDGGCNAA